MNTEVFQEGMSPELVIRGCVGTYQAGGRREGGDRRINVLEDKGHGNE